MGGGARGVQLFYVASALTLCLSWEFRSRREASPLRNFYLRRWFRIAPMFYVAIAAYVALYGLAPRTWAPNGVEWYYVPLTALFLNGYHPEMVTSVVPGGWSIVVEMTFYLVLPLLATRLRSLATLIGLVGISLVLDRAAGYAFRQIYLPMYPPSQAYLVDNFTFLNFFGQFPVFAIGMLAYGVSRRPQWHKPVVFAGGAAFMGWAMAWPAITGATAAQMLSKHIVLGAGFAVLALALWSWPMLLFVNPVTQWIGKLSFSMYLAHFAVLDAFGVLGFSASLNGNDGGALLHYTCVVIMTAGVSWVSYRLIERPGIDWGRRLIAHFEGQHLLRRGELS